MADQLGHRLVLWDIDHTLMETRGLGAKLMRTAFEAATGVPFEHEVEVTGRTELGIAAQLLRAHGLQPDDNLIARYRDELVRQYQDHSVQLRQQARALPGAEAALAAVSQVPNVVQSVLTGNFRAVAVVKLEVFGLDRHIDFNSGAFGEDSPERAQLVPLARQRAGAKHGVDFAHLSTVIVGDSEGDVTAALTGGAYPVAVASGSAGEQLLREAGAEIVLPDLLDTRRLLEAVLEHR